MTVPSAGDLAKIRTHPQNTKMYLSVYQPTTVLACQVNNASISRGARIIAYDNVTAGSALLVRSGMTALVGTTPGGFDRGTVRVRSSTGSVLTVAENYDIAWGDDDYVTVINFFEINAVLPRVIVDPDNSEETLWYKDYDIEYTNQNSVLGSFVCMGNHYAGFKEDSVYYSAAGTLNLKSEDLSYFWFFEGATVTGSTSQVPGYITYDTPGHYTTRLIVSGTASADVSYRHVSIYDRPDAGTTVPILDWELTDLTGSREQGGYTAKIRIREDVPHTLIREGSLIVVYSDDWYGDLATRYFIGGNATNRGKNFFVGYVIKGSIQYNYRESFVEFEIGSPTEIMKMADGFGITVEDSSDPDNIMINDPLSALTPWNYVLNMDIRRALYHYLRWHSTALLCCDVEFIGTDRDIQFYNSDVGSLFDAVQSYMVGAFAGKLCADRQGKLWLERDIFIENERFATNLNFTISRQDWVGDPSIQESLTNSVCYLEVGGTAYDGTASPPTSSPLLTNSPGANFTRRGKSERVQGFALIDQDELNTMAGHMFAQKNSVYPSIDLKMAGMYKCYDIAPQEVIPFTLNTTDTVRGISFSSKEFSLQSIQYNWKPTMEALMTEISLYELAASWPGTTVTIPVVPVTDDNQINVPPIRFPSIPTITIDTGTGSGVPNFIPVNGGESSTTLFPDADYLVSEQMTAIVLPDGVFGQAWSPAYLFPAGTYVFTPLYVGVSDTSGVIYGGHSSMSAPLNGSDITEDGATLTASVTTVTSKITLASQSLTVTLSVASFISLNYWRYGSFPQDTFASSVALVGWMVE